MLRPVVAVADARRVGRARQAVTGFSGRPGGVHTPGRLRDPLERRGLAGRLKSIGAELIRGHGRLDDHRRVAVATSDGGMMALTARHVVVICTGSRPDLPELPGLAEARPGGVVPRRANPANEGERQ